ncbi:MAG: class I SAM-dependent methyltransferase [Defluviitaleaceae bacterium]|nr:class I SAM-dependent methyltransferase [Defluviitaleaceae bacterium]
MQLSTRLLKVAELVRHNTLVDIGTDHAHLPIFLAQRGRISVGLATDIAQGPLKRGHKNAKDAGVAHIIRFHQGKGLAGVKIGFYETCTITGMGGETIIAILRDNIKVAKSFKQLILSPQRDALNLRRFLHSKGFAIHHEEIVEDGNKLYNILDCKPNPENPYNEAGYAFGQVLISNRHPLLSKLINLEIQKLKNIPFNTLPPQRQTELEKYSKLCLEVLKCL